MKNMCGFKGNVRVGSKKLLSVIRRVHYILTDVKPRVYYIVTDVDRKFIKKWASGKR